MRLRPAITALVPASLLVATSLTTATPVHAMTTGGGAERRTPEPAVLVVSIDGLRPDAVERLGDRLTAIPRLAATGASTLNARTIVERTETLPNHTSMLTGRRLRGEDGTSVTFNDDTGGTLAQAHGSYVPGIFDVAHDRGRTTALFAEKDKFRFLLRSWGPRYGARDAVGADDGRDKVDRSAIAADESLVPRVRRALFRGGVDLVFWHLRDPDSVGHESGWMSAAYLDAVVDADAEVAQVLDALAAHPRQAARTTVVLTSDHGGATDELSHYDATNPQNFRVGFWVAGPGVEPGADLYDLNPDRPEPALAERPGYRGAQPVRNLDVAALVLDRLGLPGLSGTLGARTGPLALAP